ncbi:hypothetical protein CGZ69_02475 [Streptomyces peucetius subsp. caesius ATCC 27952]|nr:hypothetical protein CGZ69_02475 [Streptomyces peucetius subsp. caesius ATCC 27952]
MDRAAWEAVIPSMGLMALARNLRNFDDRPQNSRPVQRSDTTPPGPRPSRSTKRGFRFSHPVCPLCTSRTPAQPSDRWFRSQGPKRSASSTPPAQRQRQDLQA